MEYPAESRGLEDICIHHINFKHVQKGGAYKNDQRDCEFAPLWATKAVCPQLFLHVPFLSSFLFRPSSSCWGSHARWAAQGQSGNHFCVSARGCDPELRLPTNPVHKARVGCLGVHCYWALCVCCAVLLLVQSSRRIRAQHVPGLGSA